jgi:hypothetical protein
MQIDKTLFPVHTIDLNNSKVLIRLEQVEGAKGKNVIIGEERPKILEDKILAREVVIEKTPDGNKNYCKSYWILGASKFRTKLESDCCLDATSETGFSYRLDRSGPGLTQDDQTKAPRSWYLEG